MCRCGSCGSRPVTYISPTTPVPLVAPVPAYPSANNSKRRPVEEGRLQWEFALRDKNTRLPSCGGRALPSYIHDSTQTHTQHPPASPPKYLHCLKTVFVFEHLRRFEADSAPDLHASEASVLEALFLSLQSLRLLGLSVLPRTGSAAHRSFPSEPSIRKAALHTCVSGQGSNRSRSLLDRVFFCVVVRGSQRPVARSGGVRYVQT